MDKFILKIERPPRTKKIENVKLDDLAAEILMELSIKTGLDYKYIASEMIHFCYRHLEIKEIACKFREDEHDVLQ